MCEVPNIERMFQSGMHFPRDIALRLRRSMETLLSGKLPNPSKSCYLTIFIETLLDDISDPQYLRSVLLSMRGLLSWSNT